MIITSGNIFFGGEIKMKGVAMYYTVKTMLEHGKSISAIARDLGIDRKTVRKIRDRVKNGEIKTPIIGYFEKGFFRIINSLETNRKRCIYFI